MPGVATTSPPIPFVLSISLSRAIEADVISVMEEHDTHYRDFEKLFTCKN